MENYFSLFLINLAAASVFMTAGWIISLIRHNVTIADSLWGLGFVLIAWLTFFNSDGFIVRKTILVLLVSLWGLRLFIHLNARNRGKGEDPRYAQWRKKHGTNFWLISLFKVFLIQALFQWAISLGIQYGQAAELPERLTFFDFVGIMIWTAGFIIESAADLQLSVFIKTPGNKGKIMNTGLWRYSRHPNYFGESLIWWGIFVIVLSTPWGIWTVISPLLITYTLLKLTGVTLMEEVEFGDNTEYQKYVSTTSPFIPWFPRKQK
jgi:steroid 5-alpha reductase family enzyme